MEEELSLRSIPDFSPDSRVIFVRFPLSILNGWWSVDESNVWCFCLFFLFSLMWYTHHNHDDLNPDWRLLLVWCDIFFSYHPSTTHAPFIHPTNQPSTRDDQTRRHRLSPRWSSSWWPVINPHQLIRSFTSSRLHWLTLIQFICLFSSHSTVNIHMNPNIPPLLFVSFCLVIWRSWPPLVLTTSHPPLVMFLSSLWSSKHFE